MLRILTDSWVASVEQRLREFGPGVAVAAAVALLAAISLGFVTFAAYAALGSSLGRVMAALIVAGVYGLAALAVAGVYLLLRRRATIAPSSQQPWAAASGSAAGGSTPHGIVESVLQAIGGPGSAGSPESHRDLAAMIQLGKKLSMPQFLALTLLGGFIAGRRFRK